MISEDTMELDEDVMDYEDEDTYDPAELDDMLEALAESNGNGLAERARRRRQGRRAKRKGVKTAQGKSAFREPGSGAFVNQKQFKEALDRVGDDVRRNAEGIKSVNERVNALNARVDGVVSAATVYSREIAKLEKRMKIGGALEMVEALNGTNLDAYQLFKGAAMSGMLGDGKGALGNPAIVGGLALVLRNRSILDGVLNRTAAATTTP